MKYLFFLILTSCVSVSQVYDNDDLYVTKTNRDSVVVKYRYRDRYIYTPSPTPFYDPYEWWWRRGSVHGNFYSPYNRPNVVIIKPYYKTEKRPSRDGNGGVSVPLNRRRGRN